jgi:hypothetical protein
MNLPEPSIIIAVAVGLIILSIISSGIAASKGKDGTSWFIASLLVTPIITMAIALMIDDRKN